jgi:DNA-directed RNA polymerase sigma subunit (sigma70/sigma32)
MTLDSAEKVGRDSDRKKENTMAQDNLEETVPEERRKEIFMALVDAQDHELSVTQSRKMIAKRFSVSEEQVRKIEREGLDQQWPPL